MITVASVLKANFGVDRNGIVFVSLSVVLPVGDIELIYSIGGHKAPGHNPLYN